MRYSHMSFFVAMLGSLTNHMWAIDTQAATQETLAVAAAEDFAAKQGWDLSTLIIKPNCADGICSVEVYSKELDSGAYKGYRGCPVKVCVTLEYSLEADSVVNFAFWR